MIIDLELTGADKNGIPQYDLPKMGANRKETPNAPPVPPKPNHLHGLLSLVLALCGVALTLLTH
jgi:hypothetical protein